MGTLLPVLLSADALGVLLGWRYLDHLGHLGGAAFGEQPSLSPHSNLCQAYSSVWCVALSNGHCSHIKIAMRTDIIDDRILGGRDFLRSVGLVVRMNAARHENIIMCQV